VSAPSPLAWCSSSDVRMDCKAHQYKRASDARGVRTAVCPAKAGVFSRRQTYQGKSQSPVARSAGGRETNLLKPLDSLIFRMGASFQAVAQANAEVASKVRSPGGRACNREGEGSMGSRRLADTTHPLRRGWERRHGNKDTLSNWRSPPHPTGTPAEKGRSYNRCPGQSTEDERVAEGAVGARKRGKARGAKGPYCS
jgi:hypothetical protein